MFLINLPGFYPNRGDAHVAGVEVKKAPEPKKSVKVFFGISPELNF